MLTKLGHLVYKLTPAPGLRKFYFETYCRLVSQKTITRDVDGVRYRLDLGELIDLATYLGKFEPKVVAAIQRYCKPGMVVFDIGANVGAHALRFAKIVGEQGMVYAFEPTEYAYDKLSTNMSLNPQLNIQAFRVALSDHEARGVPIDFRASWRTDGHHRRTDCQVDFLPLDAWAAQREMKALDLIKIDVDGNEYGVLAGATQVLSRFKPVLLMELVGPHFADPARNPFLLLERLGYRFQNVEDGTSYASAADMAGLASPDDVHMSTSINLVALPAGRSA